MAKELLLLLIARGNSILSEITRLSSHIPSAFQTETLATSNERAILGVGLEYFIDAEPADKVREASAKLRKCDEDLRSTLLEVLERFYMVFEAIILYYRDLDRLLADVEAGLFVQETIDTLLEADDSGQWLTEAMFLYGSMLLSMDRLIPGLVRERMLVAYRRWKGPKVGYANFDDVCKLCRDTGILSKTPTYPEAYFQRFPLSRQCVLAVLGKLRSQDIYHQQLHYPVPDHRSCALSMQASMMFVILFFATDILHGDQAKMREIVDKHLPDQWVLSYHMGTIVDLTVDWDSFKAAKMALSNVIEQETIKRQVTQHLTNINELNTQITGFLDDGVMTDEFVLDNTRDLMTTMRASNVALRWILTHNTTRNKTLAQLLLPFREIRLDIVKLMINSAHMEYTLKSVIKNMLETKASKWNSYKTVAADRMREMSEYFSGTKPLTHGTKNENLELWFDNISKQISQLDYLSDPLAAGRRCVQYSQALDEVGEFHQLESSIQAKAYLTETKLLLNFMIRLLNVKESVIVTIGVVNDFTYAWEILRQYVRPMQLLLQQDPHMVVGLRSLFVKIASAMDLPLLRLTQAQSRDLINVSQYYSGVLVQFVTDVMQIIPTTLFMHLDVVIQIQTNSLVDPPSRIAKIDLGGFVHLDDRFRLAKAMQSISKLCEGLLLMEKTLMGVIEVVPRQLLENGLRRELVGRLNGILQRTTKFTGKLRYSNQELSERLALCTRELSGLKRSFESIQDNMNVCTSKMWLEEYTRVMGFMEDCTISSSSTSNSIFQNSMIFIPPPGDSTVFGRIIDEMMRITIGSSIFYSPKTCGWYDAKHGQDLLSVQTMRRVQQAIGATGLQCLDRIFGNLIRQNLREFFEVVLQSINVDVGSGKDNSYARHIKATAKALENTSVLPPAYAQLYPNMVLRTEKTLFITTVKLCIVNIGKLALIRKLVRHSLRTCAWDQARLLVSCTQACSESLELEGSISHLLNSDKVMRVAELMDSIGQGNIMSRQYETWDWIGVEADVSLVHFLFMVSLCEKLKWDSDRATLVWKIKAESFLDGVPVCTFLSVALHHLSLQMLAQVFAYTGQYLRTWLNVSGVEMDQNLQVLMRLLTMLKRVDDTLTATIDRHCGLFIFSQ